MKDRGANLALTVSPGIKNEETQGQGAAEALHPQPRSHSPTPTCYPLHLLSTKQAAAVFARSTAGAKFLLVSFDKHPPSVHAVLAPHWVLGVPL